MAKINYDIYQINGDSLSRFDEITSDESRLIPEVNITQTFDSNNHFIELSYFSLDNVRLQTFNNYRDYSILSGDTLDSTDGNTQISIDVKRDYIERGYETQEVKALYNFLNYVYSDSFNPQDFVIQTISSDRTELRLSSVNLGDSDVEEITDRLIERFETDTYLPDVYLYFENNIYYSIVNIQRDFFRDSASVLIKLLKPLPIGININQKLNVVEKIGDPVAYEINISIENEQDKIPYLRGPNFAVEIDSQNVEPSKYFNYNELFSFPTNNTYRQLSSLFNEKGAELGIDYSDYSHFINFSSAEERIRNFKYKLDLVESYQTNLDLINQTSNDYTATGITGSREFYQGLIDGLINNLDHYERHLYYESGSTSWPKVENSSYPYVNQLSETDEATTFFNSEISDAINFDAQNQDLLANTIPSFLREDEDNRPYELFVHMIAQHFDNLWIYTDAISKKYDADNRLNRGVSKDLIEELLKNFGVKLYTSNRSLEDLFRYFTFDSYDLGSESSAFINVAATNYPISQNDYQKSIYKRIYHNLSLLMKSKGTERGLRALINCFGIPSDILKIKIYGGQRAQDLPYFGGEQAFTGSVDKVRTNNTGSIVPGSTVSYYTSILNSTNDYTQDLHRIEVGFSPSDNIDNYIVSQSAVLFPNDPFNIDQYIGDPRQSLTNRYQDLKDYSSTIFENVDAYNVKDFVRLIKFFDNVVFRMVRDFTPARAITDAGIIIKPHLLDRSKAIAPIMTWTQPEYTGSVDTAFIEAKNGGIYDSLSAFTSTGEAVTDYLKQAVDPFAAGPRIQARRVNNFDALGLADKIQVEKNFGETKYDGELAGSRIRISNGELNSDNPFKQIKYPTIEYNVQFYSEIPDEFCILTIPNSNVFPVSPNQLVNIPGSNIFIGDTATAYTFSVGDGETTSAPNQGDGFTHLFEGDQYDEFVVTAVNNNSSLSNQVTGEPNCSAERVVKIVDCRINDNNGNVINPMTLNTTYNLFNIFFSEPTLNTDLTFFVNGVEVGNTVDGNTEVNITFEDDNISQVLLEVKDTHDPNCNRNLIVDFSPCALADPNSLLSQFERDLLIPGYTTSGTIPFWLFPFGFVGLNNTTSVKFQLFVGWNSDHTRLNSQEYEDEFLSNEVQVENPLPGSNISLIPNNYGLIVSTFRNSPIPEGGLPQGTTEGLNPFTTSNGLGDGQIIQGNHDPYFVNNSVEPNSPYQDRNYRTFIRFIADNGLVNGVACSVVSRFYSLKSAIYQKIAVNIMYAQSTQLSSAFLGCQIATNQTTTVYVRVPETVSSVDPETVVKNKMMIFKNSSNDDDTKADAGFYMYGGDVVTSMELTGEFSNGRRGRFFMPEGNNTGVGDRWDDTTVQPANGNIVATNCIFLEGTPGLFVCTNSDHGFTDAEIDDPFNNNDFDPQTGELPDGGITGTGVGKR